ncbi:MAG TPA: SDR family oxidoreductase [Candidatus Xenobia bacterium]|jgi:NAD(P)-dependent dehydrogenase (short-subunit alcohol dehydrogenase family)
MELFNLQARTAVIVGPTGVLASRMVHGLAAAGASLALVGRDRGRLDALAEQVGARTFLADATDPAALRRVAEQVGRVDILVNAVGGNRPLANATAHTPFDTIPAAALREVVDLNLMAGAILPSQAFAEALSAQGGVIVNLTSMAADRPLTRVLGYAAAKAAVANFTRWLAVELAPRQVRVNAIAPGFFLGEQNRALLVDETGTLTDRGRRIIEHTPMARFGDPDDLVGTLLWLCSDASRFVTGIVVPVDGGFSAYAGV